MADLSLPTADYYHYRSLRYVPSNPQHGCDVYALQTALRAKQYQITIDGVFGTQTKKFVLAYQTQAALTVDGIAGIATQQRLAKDIGRVFGNRQGLPVGIPYGHIEHESSFMLGNYTSLYPDGQRDEGVVQRNTNYATPAEAFNVPDSIGVLCKKVSDYHDKYKSWGVEYPRAWRLACGSWNAPAWTDTLAKGGSLYPDSYAKIVAYIDAVTAYVQW